MHATHVEESDVHKAALVATAMEAAAMLGLSCAQGSAAVACGMSCAQGSAAAAAPPAAPTVAAAEAAGPTALQGTPVTTPTPLTTQPAAPTVADAPAPTVATPTTPTSTPMVARAQTSLTVDERPPTTDAAALHRWWQRWRTDGTTPKPFVPPDWAVAPQSMTAFPTTALHVPPPLAAAEVPAASVPAAMPPLATQPHVPASPLGVATQQPAQVAPTVQASVPGLPASGSAVATEPPGQLASVVAAPIGGVATLAPQTTPSWPTSAAVPKAAIGAHRMRFAHKRCTLLLVVCRTSLL
jgi:hypothetical protein